MSEALPSYWTLVGSDRSDTLRTYEHRMPHGVLVLTIAQRGYGDSSSMVFIPAAPHPGEERL